MSRIGKPVGRHDAKNAENNRNSKGLRESARKYWEANAETILEAAHGSEQRKKGTTETAETTEKEGGGEHNSIDTATTGTTVAAILSAFRVYTPSAIVSSVSVPNKSVLRF